jgi:hypothetical protein
MLRKLVPVLIKIKPLISDEVADWKDMYDTLRDQFDKNSKNFENPSGFILTMADIFQNYLIESDWMKDGLSVGFGPGEPVAKV